MSKCSVEQVEFVLSSVYNMITNKDYINSMLLLFYDDRANFEGNATLLDSIINALAYRTSGVNINDIRDITTDRLIEIAERGAFSFDIDTLTKSLESSISGEFKNILNDSIMGELDGYGFAKIVIERIGIDNACKISQNAIRLLYSFVYESSKQAVIRHYKSKGLDISISEDEREDEDEQPNTFNIARQSIEDVNEAIEKFLSKVIPDEAPYKDKDIDIVFRNDIRSILSTERAGLSMYSQDIKIIQMSKDMIGIVPKGRGIVTGAGAALIKESIKISSKVINASAILLTSVVEEHDIFNDLVNVRIDNNTN